MKDSELHIGLDKADVRDVIARGLISTFEREGTAYTYISGRTRLEEAAEKLRIAKQNYEAIKEQEAYITIMKSMGWDEFDMSDEVGLTPGNKYYLSFIGTQEEYDALMKDIESKKYCFDVGDRVRYKPQNHDEYVYTEVREAPERINFPSIELSNGHQANWDGEKYVISELNQAILEEA